VRLQNSSRNKATRQGQSVFGESSRSE
jgi:hypothetical protein